MQLWMACGWNISRTGCDFDPELTKINEKNRKFEKNETFSKEWDFDIAIDKGNHFLCWTIKSKSL